MIININKKERIYIIINQLYKNTLSFYSNNTKNYILYYF